VADINGDMQLDIITGADAGGGPHVKVFDGNSGAEIASFMAFETTFTGGVRVAAGDLAGTIGSNLEIVAARGPGAVPEVRTFDGLTGTQVAGPLGSFLAYDAGFNGGVYVAVGELNGNFRSEIITGAGAGAAPHVKVFDGDGGDELLSFLAYDAGFTGGVRVAAGDVTGDGRDELITGAGPGAGPHVRTFNGMTGLEIAPPLGSFFAFEISFTGGVFVAGVQAPPGILPIPTTSGFSSGSGLTASDSDDESPSSDEETSIAHFSDLDELFAEENLLGELLTGEFA
jgi:hypothetical protein